MQIKRFAKTIAKTLPVFSIATSLTAIAVALYVIMLGWTYEARAIVNNSADNAQETWRMGQIALALLDEHHEDGISFVVDVNARTRCVTIASTSSSKDACIEASNEFAEELQKKYSSEHPGMQTALRLATRDNVDNVSVRTNWRDYVATCSACCLTCGFAVSIIWALRKPKSKWGA